MGNVAERRVGSVIGGKWRVDSLLGSGSMAAVYAVTHRNGARAALKILHPALCADPEICERFLGEGYLTNTVKHPAVVRVLDDGVTDDGCVFLLMDLLEGATLEALRRERGGRLGLEETLEIADKLMDALEAVHDAGVVHRDLKPQNVFVCDDGAVRLLDFGVARLLDGASGKLSIFGMVLGTPSFMSPEQALGARELVDDRSDIWSLGATLFTTLTGETVHLGPHPQAKILAAATMKPRSISAVLPDLPQPVAGAIDTALRFDRDDRWESVRAFRRALRDARARTLAGGQSEPDAPGEAAPPARGVGAPSPAPSAPAAARAERAPAAAAPGAPSARRSDGPGSPAEAKAQRVAPVRRLSPQVGSRRSTVGAWLAGAAVAALATGGAAWLLVERAAGERVIEPELAESTGPAEGELTSATLPASSASPEPMPTVSVDALDRIPDAPDRAESPLKASAKPAPRAPLPRPAARSPWRPAPAPPPPERAEPAPAQPPKQVTELPDLKTEPSTTAPDPPLVEREREEPRSSVLAPDPFGTPD